MITAPDSSPFALTEHVFATNVAGHSLLFWTANGLALVGVGAAIVWGTRKMIGAALGKQ
ncbi:MAG TPA: hypothetical protein VHA78_01185 [Candidatus Peribacteraceae bacterium]|nr:hypothetical protein [Candidatus Peribacteraceae bacterium]